MRWDGVRGHPSGLHPSRRRPRPWADHAARITQVGTVGIPVDDQERALAFYHDALGFETRMDSEYGERQRWLEVAPPGAATSIALVQSHDAYRLVVVNLGNATAQGRVWIAHEVPGRAQIELTDTLDGQVYGRSRADLEAHGLYVRLDANRAHLFAVTA